MVTKQTVNEVSDKQKSILCSSAPLVKPGGRIAYATCTLLSQENEDVVEEFIVRHPHFSLVEANRLLEKWHNELITAGTFF